MTDAEEMERRQRACELVAEMIREVYAGKPSSKEFLRARISASSIVSKTAESYAKELIQAYETLEAGGAIPMKGSYWGFWGDMASTRILEGPEVNIDGTEFWVYADLGDGWIMSAHPDGAKKVEIDDRKYVVLVEQKNYDNVTPKKRLVALRQGALYAGMIRATLKQTGGYVFGDDPNYLRPGKHLSVLGDEGIAGVVRSICSPRPPGEAHPYAFSDEDMDAWFEQCVLKAQHVKIAVEMRDLDYARKWDSEHVDEFGGIDASTGDERKQVIAEFVSLRKAAKDIKDKMEEMRPTVAKIANDYAGRFELDGYSAKFVEASGRTYIDANALRADGIDVEKYTKKAPPTRRLLASMPGVADDDE